MKNLVPRLVGETEAKMLGVQHGWYGTKASGTFVTGPSPSLEACIAEMDQLPEPPEVAKDDALVIEKQNTLSDSSDYNAKVRTAYRLVPKSRS